MSELKPCPLCEGTAHIEATVCDTVIRCDGHCGARITSDNHENQKAVEAELVKIWNTRPQPADAELVDRMQDLMCSLGAVEACGDGISDLEKECYQVLDKAIAALSAKPNVAHQIADRLPIWMLDTYDRDSLSSMLSAVSYLKQCYNNLEAENERLRGGIKVVG